MNDNFYHVYDLNKAYEDFISRWGVEPNGLLMRDETYDLLRETASSMFTVTRTADMSFRGMPIYRSAQMNINRIRFVI